MSEFYKFSEVDEFNRIMRQFNPIQRKEIEIAEKLMGQKEALRQKNVDYKLKKMKEKEKDYLSPDEFI
jgi:hypothetical protein